MSHFRESQSNAERAERSKKRNELCPSKSTVYLGNISFSLTNNDLIKMLEHIGRVVSAKIVKHKESRKSKGYAFVQFLKVEDAQKCIEEYHEKEVFGRRWVCKIANDNGRTEEFIRKRTYPDKSRCYECGEYGHLSLKCPKNALGDREPPKKKRRKKHKSEGSRGRTRGGDNDDDKSYKNYQSSSESDAASPDENEVDTLSSAITLQRALEEEREYRERVASGNYEMPTASSSSSLSVGSGGGTAAKKLKFVKDGYFSDEEVLVEKESQDIS